MREFVLPSASNAYRAKRAALLEAEEALKQQREAVARMRRDLPDDTPVEENYTFQQVRDGTIRSVGLADLFANPELPLILIHFMWKPGDNAPCPMCTMWADGYNAARPHVAGRANFVVVAKQEVGEFSNFANERGWHHLPFASSGGSSFNADFGMETGDGGQLPGVSVFALNGGKVRHTYTVSAMIGEDRRRGLDILNPTWNLFDLLPEGRGEFFPKLAYA